MPSTVKSPVKKPANGRRRSSFTRLNKALDKALEAMLDNYFKMLANYETQHLYELVLARVEKKLLEYVLQLADFNQSRAASMLGISRSTLRTKIRAHNIPARKPPSAPRKPPSASGT